MDVHHVAGLEVGELDVATQLRRDRQVRELVELAKAEFPSMKEGTDFYPAQNDNFFVGNAFPTCGINFTAQEIMGQTEANK